ncbi:MAG: hypothetical protein R3C01_04700 [Planctomycetaceae bacterium]
MLASTWRAPLPMLHCHGDSTSDEGICRLLQLHIEDFHANSSAVAPYEWHLHFVLPWESESDGDVPCDFYYPTLLTQLVDCDASGSFVTDGADGGELSAGLCRVQVDMYVEELTLEQYRHCGSIGSFHEVSLSSRPLSTITGVSLC